MAVFSGTMSSSEIIYYVAVYIMVFLFGITIGSFLNVCILRLPKGESLIKQNSHCMTCGAQIKRYDLIPLFSWLLLGGKCRSCKAPISPRYSVVEGLTGILFVLVFMQHDFISDGLIYSALLCLFIAGVIVIGFQDWDTQEMCLSVLIFLGRIAFATRVMSVLLPTALRGNDISITEGLIGMFAVSVPILLIGFVITPVFHMLFIDENRKEIRKLKKRLKYEKLSPKSIDTINKSIASHKEEIKETGVVFGFGMGDVVFMAAAGLMLGWKAIIVAMFIAILLGAVAALIIKLRNRKNEDETSNAFAFGPYLAIGIGIATFCGTYIFNAYAASLHVG